MTSASLWSNASTQSMTLLFRSRVGTMIESFIPPFLSAGEIVGFSDSDRALDRVCQGIDVFAAVSDIIHSKHWVFPWTSKCQLTAFLGERKPGTCKNSFLQSCSIHSGMTTFAIRNSLGSFQGKALSEG